MKKKRAWVFSHTSYIAISSRGPDFGTSLRTARVVVRLQKVAQAENVLETL
jgi:hypothetical protein